MNGPSAGKMPVTSPTTGSASTSTVPARSLGRIPALDGLRGVTVIIVFISHLEVILPIPSLAVVPGGTVSLDSFFVLSGFLITSIMLREQARTGAVQRYVFYRRRAIRLLPPLFALLFAQTLFAFVTGVSWHLEWTSVASVVFYYENYKLALHSNYLGGILAPGLAHLWSLSLEEQFYLVWPWVTIFLLTIRTRLRTVVIVLISLITAIAVHRAMMYHGPNSWYADFVRTDTRADGILIGCLLAHIWMRGREPKRFVRPAAWIALVFLLICLPTVDTLGPFLFRGGIVAIDVACATILLALVEGHWGARHFFSFPPFVVLGTVSYGFYLWHLLVFAAVRYYGNGWNEVTRVVVAVIVTLIMTAISWFLLERPALDWKDRLEGRAPTPRTGWRSLIRNNPGSYHGPTTGGPPVT